MTRAPFRAHFLIKLGPKKPSQVTSFHPPLMVWIGGIVDFGTSAAVMILTGQLLIAIGLVYFYRTPPAKNVFG